MFLGVQVLERTFDGNSIYATPTYINVLHIRKVQSNIDDDDYVDIYMDNGEVLTVSGTVAEFQRKIYMMFNDCKNALKDVPKKK